MGGIALGDLFDFLYQLVVVWMERAHTAAPFQACPLLQSSMDRFRDELSAQSQLKRLPSAVPMALRPLGASHLVICSDVLYQLVVVWMERSHTAAPFQACPLLQSSMDRIRDELRAQSQLKR